jgi:hypothetical protein
MEFMEASERPAFPSGSPYEDNAADRAPGENPPNDVAAGPGVEGAEEEEEEFTDARLIERAREIYTASTDYMTANITNTWEKNISHFHSEHAPGSVMRSRARKRSSVFRPKTRSVTKSQEAALAVAMFSTDNKVQITPQNPRDKTQQISAKINKSILEYRLKKRMPWFQTVLGAYQCSKVYGVCIGHQYWRYDVDTDIVPVFNDDDTPVMNEAGDAMGEKQRVVRRDELVCDLIAPENFRFDPMCDWRDPAGSSPYLIMLQPMYVEDALERMERYDPKTDQPVWKRYTESEVLSTRKQNYDRTRQAREGRERRDPADDLQDTATASVWAHFNIIRLNGTDVGYWTMGTELLLTDPVPLTQLFPHLREGERPFVMGTSSIEALRNYPSGDVEQYSGLQSEMNLIVNQRIDNVKLAMNRRYYVKRGAQVDLEALVRNVPGGGVMMNDPERDIKTVETPDVTQNSYQEQNLLALEMDDIAGAFTPGAGGSPSNTARGMEQQSAGAGAVQDYGIRVFLETWVEPVLRQFVRLIQMYETDEVILALAAEQAQVFQKFGSKEIPDALLQQELTVNVDVGMGNTDPMRRVERLLFGVTNSLSIPGMAERVKASAIADEIFSTLGYRDSTRFFLNDEEFEELQKANPKQDPPEIVLKRQEIQVRREDNLNRHGREMQKLEREIKIRELELKIRMQIASGADRTKRDTAAMGADQSRFQSVMDEENVQ